MTPSDPGRFNRIDLAVAAACLVVALAFTWPLVWTPGTHLTGDPTSDTGVYVWNLWAFRYELLEHRHSPFQTDMLFVPRPERVWLGLHNYTVFADLLALPLQSRFGLITTFNIVLWLGSAANAFAFYWLARHLTRDRASAFLAALAFGFSPFLITRGTIHYSLAIAAALPVCLLLMLKARETLRYRYAIGAGIAVMWALFCDAYYGVFCTLMAACVVFDAAVVVSSAPEAVTPRQARLRRIVDGAVIAVAAAALVLALKGRGLYTPMLVLTLLVVVRVVLARRVRLSWRRGPHWGRGIRLVLAGGGAVVLACLPFLYGFVQTVSQGRYVQPDVHWRSSPPGVDLLAYVIPNPNHAWWATGRDWLRTRPNGYAENVASQSLVALAVIAWAAWRRRGALPRFWIGFTVFFLLTSLGPFIRAAGINTRVPTPWALLRYVPLVANARSPTRLAVVATLGLAVLFAFALRALLARPNGRLRLAALLGALLLVELSPVPRVLHSARLPNFYARIRDDPRDVTVLELPFGVRSGASNVGDFNAVTMLAQTSHHKRLLGGYLSRVEDSTMEMYRANPMTNVLLKLSAGESPTVPELDAAWAGRRSFLEETRVGYVIVDNRRASLRLQRFAVNALRLVPIDEEAPFDVYVPASNAPPGVEK